MYTVKEIIPYALTRDIVLQDESKYRIMAFDDSDIRGDDEFSFLKVGSSYNFKIGILGDVADTGKKFLVAGQQKIGETSFVKLRDESIRFWANSYDVLSFKFKSCSRSIG